MNTQATKLQAAENDLKQLMADVTRAMEKAQEAVAKLAAKAAAATAEPETTASPRRHPVEFRNRDDVVDPRLLRANKALPTRHQFVALAQGTDPDEISLWIITTCGIDLSPLILPSKAGERGSRRSHQRPWDQCD